MFLWAAHGGWKRHALARAYGSWSNAAEAMMFPAADRGVRTFLWEAFGAPHVLSGLVPSVPNPLRTYNAHGYPSLNTLDFRAAYLSASTKQGSQDLWDLTIAGNQLATRYGCPLAVKLGIHPAVSGVREDVLRWTVATLKEMAATTVCIDATASATVGRPERRLLNAFASAGLEALVEAAPRADSINAVPFGAAWLYRFEHAIRVPNKSLYATPSGLRAIGRECVICLGGPEFIAPDSPKQWAAVAAVYAGLGFSVACGLSEQEITDGTLDAIVEAVEGI